MTSYADHTTNIPSSTLSPHWYESIFYKHLGWFEVISCKCAGSGVDPRQTDRLDRYRDKW